MVHVCLICRHIKPVNKTQAAPTTFAASGHVTLLCLCNKVNLEDKGVPSVQCVIGDKVMTHFAIFIHDLIATCW